jgi:hypothetical protein
VSVFASGFNNPRGLKFGPDGNLYVAERGLGGANSTVGQCAQVVPPVYREHERSGERRAHLEGQPCRCLEHGRRRAAVESDEPRAGEPRRPAGAGRVLRITAH